MLHPIYQRMEIKVKGFIPKQVLARMYAKHNKTEATTQQNFGKRIHRDPLLMEKLTQVGYKVHSKVLTPKQAQIIVDSFGYPNFETTESASYIETMIENSNNY